MEYRTVWLTFFAALLASGVAVSMAPERVISKLRQGAKAPERRYVVGFRVLGGLVAVVALAEFISIVKWGRLL